MQLTDVDQQDEGLMSPQQQISFFTLLKINFRPDRRVNQQGKFVMGRDCLRYKLYNLYLFELGKQDIIEEGNQDTIEEGNQKQTIQSLLQTIKKYNFSKFSLYFEQLQLSPRKAFFTPKILDVVMQQHKFITDFTLESTITNYSIQELASSLKFLKYLNLSRYCIDSEGIIKLTQNKFKFLQTLDIFQNNIKNLGLKYLIRAQWPCLKYLRLFQCNITQDGLKYLKKHCFTKLATLGLLKDKIYQSGFKKAIEVKCERIRLPGYCRRITSQSPLWSQQEWDSWLNRGIFHNIVIKMKGIKIPQSTASIHSVKQLFKSKILLELDILYGS